MANSAHPARCGTSSALNQSEEAAAQGEKVMGPILPIGVGAARQIPETHRLASPTPTPGAGLASAAGTPSAHPSAGAEAIQATAMQMLQGAGRIENDSVLRMLIGLLILLAVLKALDQSVGAGAGDLGGTPQRPAGSEASGVCADRATIELTSTSLTISQTQARSWQGEDPNAAPGGKIDVSA